MNRISFASGIAPGCGPVETILAAAAGGFDATGLWVEPRIWTPAVTQAARRALLESGLELLDIEVIWLKPASDMDWHRKCIDIGADLGAKNILCVSSDPDMDATAARLAELCTYAEGSAMRVALEFGLFTAVKNLAMAIEVLDAVAHPSSALLIDPIHVDRSGSAIADIAALPRDLLPYAQFCDATASRPDSSDLAAIVKDALDLRLQCGEGALPLRDLHAALPVDIPLSIELRSKALRERYPDVADRARAVATATRRWLENQPPRPTH